jgi:tetrahedral aminopeptidase
MFEMNFDLLKRLCETPGIPGQEHLVRDLLRSELTPLVDEVSVDAMGNLIARRRASTPDVAPRVMIAAHMDEIGFVVKHVDGRGFVRLQPLGFWDPRAMVAQRVEIRGRNGHILTGALVTANRPAHTQTPEERGKVARLEDFYVDLGLTGAQAAQLIEPGCMVTLSRPTVQAGNAIMSKALDDRVGVFIMVEALRACGATAVEICAVGTVQEEVGCRGASPAAVALKPAVGIALDVTLAYDTPGAPEEQQVTRLGKGAAIKILDSNSISDVRLVRHFRDVAERHNIAHQLEVLDLGGTDAGGIQRADTGAPAITLSIPTRYIHTSNEMAEVSDIEACIALLARYLEDAHTGVYLR